MTHLSLIQAARDLTSDLPHLWTDKCALEALGVEHRQERHEHLATSLEFHNIRCMDVSFFLMAVLFIDTS